MVELATGAVVDALVEDEAELPDREQPASARTARRRLVGFISDLALLMSTRQSREGTHAFFAMTG
ncbi:MAG TPA: hypothetical protein VFF73_32575 [Planctomycetota bacterium]|nr:hypothetical protein [Planctomycetota bacterium]